jgi:HD-like signal output (HDOD) protein
LSRLAPYADLNPVELGIAAEQVERIHIKPGLISRQLPRDQRVFLEKGSVKVQTRTGDVLLVEAGSAQAAYPIPPFPQVASLYAPGTCSFLSVPLSVPLGPGCSHSEGLTRPQVTAEEAEALEGLRKHFRKGKFEVPSLPDLALKIGRAIDDQKNDNDDIARLIQLDPTLTARILSVVNSAAFGGISRISSIHQATARLGRDKVRNLAYSCVLKSLFNINTNALKHRMEDLWQHSANVAALSFVLGRDTPGIDPDQALLAGLVHDIGAVAIIGSIAKFPVLAQRDEVFQYAVDSLRIEAGLLTLKQWGLQDEFEDTVKNAENWFRTGSAIPEYPDVVILAQLHAYIGHARDKHLPRVDMIPAFAKLAHGELSPHKSLAILEEAEADVAEIRALISGA